ncbi:DUF998 domain-containing protein [uncultured Agrococcus sp.]|uniref:DUF998 domain-containing protein n=1 Tax=uncultured Agrococcus sp. TaxID=382258 RepID=UPI0025E8B827|nr:DUF998 domain-containing protein [uncultured Agrococcus sp.]
MDFPETATLLLRIGAAGVIGFLMIAHIEGCARRGYSHVQHPVSALALGRRGWIQIVNFAISGCAIVCGGVGILLQGSGLFLGIAVIVFGSGLALSAFPMDPMRGYPPGTAEGDPEEFSTSHNIHDWAGLIVFFSLPTVAAIAVFTLPDLWQKIAAGAAAVVLLAANYFFDKAWTVSSPKVGIIQRAFIVPGWLWLAMVFTMLSMY